MLDKYITIIEKSLNDLQAVENIDQALNKNRSALDGVMRVWYSLSQFKWLLLTCPPLLIFCPIALIFGPITGLHNKLTTL